MARFEFRSPDIGEGIAEAENKVVMPNAAFIGGTMRAETAVAELCPSKPRPGQGIVAFRHRLVNQRGETMCECLRSALLKPRG